MRAYVHRLPASAPDDASALLAAIARGNDRSPPHRRDPRQDRGQWLRQRFHPRLRHACPEGGDRANHRAIARRGVGTSVAFVMSGGTEGGLAPHWLVFEVRPEEAAMPAGMKRLAIGIAMTRPFAPEEIGRLPQVTATADAVRQAIGMLPSPRPTTCITCRSSVRLLTRARIVEAEQPGPHRGDPGHLQVDGLFARRFGARRCPGTGRGGGRGTVRRAWSARTGRSGRGAPARHPASN